MNDTTKPAAALECPFCGSTKISDGEVLTGKPSGATATQSMCEECGALGPEAILPPDEVDYGDVRAIAAWNRRAPKASAVPEGWKLVPDDAKADEIVSRLYRRFKEWSKRGFGPDDVTWCEVRADILALIAAAPSTPQAEEAQAVPSVEEFLARFLPPPGYEGHKIIERDGKLMFCLPGDVLPTDGLCFYDGDMRAVAAPERVQPSIADDKEFCALPQDYVVQKAHVCEAQKVARIRLFANIDAKLTQAWQSADVLRDRCNQLEDSNLALLDRATAAEEKLASIRAALDKE